MYLVISKLFFKFCICLNYFPISALLISEIIYFEEKLYGSLFLNNIQMALTGVAQWVEYHPTNQNATSLIFGPGTCLGCG